MDKETAPIKQRALQIADYYNIKIPVFAKKIFASKSLFYHKSLQSELGGEIIAKILHHYSEISPDWLVLGRGPMFRSNQIPSCQPPSEPVALDPYREIDYLRQIIYLKDRVHTLEMELYKYNNGINE